MSARHVRNFMRLGAIGAGGLAVAPRLLQDAPAAADQRRRRYSGSIWYAGVGCRARARRLGQADQVLQRQVPEREGDFELLPKNGYDEFPRS